MGKFLRYLGVTLLFAIEYGMGGYAIYGRFILHQPDWIGTMLGVGALFPMFGALYLIRPPSPEKIRAAQVAGGRKRAQQLIAEQRKNMGG